MVPMLLVYLAFGRGLWRLIRTDPEFQALTTTLALVLAGGTIFYWRVEPWGLFNSFYFCVITLATVGYGDYTPTTTFGKAFTIVYVFIGVGILLSFLNKFASYQTQLREERRRARAEETSDIDAPKQ